MTIFFLIRHGETDWSINEKHQLKGEYRDIASLTSKGIKQANDLYDNIDLKKAELILSSPYTRAMQTAAIISKNFNLDIVPEFDLREWQPDLNLQISNQAELKIAIDDFEREKGVIPLNSTKHWESKSQMKTRSEKVFQRYLIYNHVIVVTHEQLIKTWIDIDQIPNCSIMMIELNYDQN